MNVLIYLLAIATGLTVSTIYLLQPLLHTVAASLNTSDHEVGIIMTLTQVGYGIGIFFLIPLGDILPKKGLILFKLSLLAGALILAGLSPQIGAIALASLMIGILATAAQDIVPFAADLADESSRGAVVGKVMTGLLLGILLSRTLAGLLADAFGWRAVYFISGGSIIILSLAFAMMVERRPAKLKLKYTNLLASTLKKFVLYRDLRRSMFVQGFIGIGFSAFWTNLSFHLGKSPFELSPSQIGLFGLAGAAGAMMATLAGKFSDKHGPRPGILIGSSLVFVSFVAMYLAPNSIAMIIVGALVFDLGAQMSLVSNQSLIYALEPEARSQINALFVTAIFTAFALGSFVSVQLFEKGGWKAVMALCAISSALSAAMALVKFRNREVFAN